MSYSEAIKRKLKSNKEAMSIVASGDQLWFAPINDTPCELLRELCLRYEELADVMVWSCLVSYPLEVFDSKYLGHIGYSTLFLGGYERKFYSGKNINFGSVSLSNYEKLMQRVIKPKISVLSVSPPDENGNFFYGPGGVLANSYAVAISEIVIVNINKNIKPLSGEGNFINIKDVDIICENDFEIAQLPDDEIGENERRIAAHIIERIKDGDTLQIGIGAIANAVAYGLEGRKDLGVHSEMMTNSLMHLTKSGIITCERKNFMKNRIVCSFASGSNELYDFLPECELIHFAPVSWVNDYKTISQNDNLISINGALMVDLTGQVCSESVGFRQFSGTGGQLDFVMGANGSKGGKSFFVLPSTITTKTGVESRIRLSLPEGGVVTTPRSCVQNIVSEFGVADLFMRSNEYRVKELVKIAHPDFREQLLFDAKKQGIII